MPPAASDPSYSRPLMSATFRSPHNPEHPPFPLHTPHPSPQAPALLSIKPQRARPCNGHPKHLRDPLRRSQSWRRSTRRGPPGQCTYMSCLYVVLTCLKWRASRSVCLYVVLICRAHVSHMEGFQVNVFRLLRVVRVVRLVAKVSNMRRCLHAVLVCRTHCISCLYVVLVCRARIVFPCCIYIVLVCRACMSCSCCIPYVVLVLYSLAEMTEGEGYPALCICEI
jgi:hypothetical protein